jgi:class 3 adenylate cyclase
MLHGACCCGLLALASLREQTKQPTISRIAPTFLSFVANRTIGDCYLAVTGLPEAQEDHATIMCRFANDMVLKMSEIRNDLVDRLGPETAELQLRVGLHSGPVTAGVLRGQKSRFQLFGDTVNTASRMESTGEKGQIQLSQTTAEELMARGKGHWLVPRQNKVVAKGKGEMQTYWLRLKSTKLSMTSGDTYISNESPVEGASEHGDETEIYV